MTMYKMFSLLLAVLFLAGCQPARAAMTSLPPEPADSQPPATPLSVATLPDRMDASMTQQPDSLSPTDSGTPVTGEAPADLIAAILQDLAQRTGADPQRVVVIRAQAVVWNDGSLGCPQPGMFYTQALVRGYWVVLALDGKTYDYHAAESGYFVLCENGLPPFGTPGVTDK